MSCVENEAMLTTKCFRNNLNVTQINLVFHGDGTFFSATAFAEVFN
jgi:hypothetical protein